MTERTVISAKPADEPAAKVGLHVGLIGSGIGQSRTPKMHMEEGAALGLPYRYDLIDVASLERKSDIATLLDQAEKDGLAGVNVTYPFKQTVIEHLDDLSDAARTVEAVNTVVFRDGKRFGHNTDYWGYTQAFSQALAETKKDRVLLLGAGGAGGAVASALMDLGVGHLTIYDKSASAAELLKGRLLRHSKAQTVSIAQNLDAEIENADGLVNATPVGMAPLPGSPIPIAQLHTRQWVSDIIYFPLETELLAAARAKGCQTMNGSGMAVFQAARAFKLITGIEPDPDRMRATFNAFTPPNAG